VLSDRDGIVLKRNQVQEEYSSMPEHRAVHYAHNDLIQCSFDISVKEDNEIVRTCQVNDKW